MTTNNTELEKDKCDCCHKTNVGSMIYLGGEPIRFECKDCNPTLYHATYKVHFVELAEQQERPEMKKMKGKRMC